MEVIQALLLCAIAGLHGGSARSRFTMHPISLIFLGLCAFLFGFWFVRWLEQRRVRRSDMSIPSTSRPEMSSASGQQSATVAGTDTLSGFHQHAVQELLTQNRKVEAIQYLRDHTGWSLSQAKSYVEQTASPIRETDLPPKVVAAIRQLMAEKQKIAAIKLVRNHTGWGLKEAKDYVENL